MRLADGNINVAAKAARLWSSTPWLDEYAEMMKVATEKDSAGGVRERAMGLPVCTRLMDHDGCRISPW
jgi:hypothetical protein